MALECIIRTFTTLIGILGSHCMPIWCRGHRKATNVFVYTTSNVTFALYEPKVLTNLDFQDAFDISLSK